MIPSPVLPSDGELAVILFTACNAPPEVNQEIQELKKELKELNQLVKALLTVTDEGGTVNADSLVIKMLKLKVK